MSFATEMAWAHAYATTRTWEQASCSLSWSSLHGCGLKSLINLVLYLCAYEVCRTIAAHMSRAIGVGASILFEFVAKKMNQVLQTRWRRTFPSERLSLTVLETACRDGHVYLRTTHGEIYIGTWTLQKCNEAFGQIQYLFRDWENAVAPTWCERQSTTRMHVLDRSPIGRYLNHARTMYGDGIINATEKVFISAAE